MEQQCHFAGPECSDPQSHLRYPYLTALNSLGWSLKTSGLRWPLLWKRNSVVQHLRYECCTKVVEFDLGDTDLFTEVLLEIFDIRSKQDLIQEINDELPINYIASDLIS